MAERRDVGVALLHAFQADAALGEFADDDLVERGDFELVFGGQFDFRFFQNNFPFAVLEIETVGQFLFWPG